MTRSWMRWTGGLLIAAAALLAGCATGYRMDNSVQSFSALTALPANPTYRFEWLPSQRGPAQSALEAMADPALFQAGLRRDDASPRYSVQVEAGLQRMRSPWADPWDPGWGWGWGVGLGARRGGGAVGLGFGSPFWPRAESPWYRREVRVLMRDLSNNQVVYETRAVNEGPWLDDAVAYPALFQAALQGFPNPPPGPRRVDLQVGGSR
ncbi:DUF4136 domain-containing protein [Ramlibacter sp. AW1]|uniref:DUF4136 domain-containing protein n=1 Tax=Ramlibacter aurantiacus TaxID=2801330 RepID=A0A936ZV23_9BURK|nr:DUF4136 domain-containing protein [Ramlibacter aurantiacus]MBL0421680.1 DUF4136 domain-containing protein [Ramlibacter aurantiacus]